MRTPIPIPRNSRRGVALLVVLWAIVIAMVVITGLQANSFSQAVGGREALGRVRATWAARAGIEATLARMEASTLDPNPNDAFAIYEDMAAVAEGSFDSTSYLVSHAGSKGEELGPADAHAKLNINRMTRDQLLTIEPFMTEDVADAVLDWIDPDDDTISGAERSYYQSTLFAYIPRNAPMRTIQELELVAGVEQSDVRGEDWNLDGVLDPNEDDGDLSFPRDNKDGKLDAGWSGVLTAESVDGGLTSSGEQPLDLKTASDSDVAKRISVTSEQATAIVTYAGSNPTASMRDFIRRDLGQLAQTQPTVPGAQPRRVEALTDEQLAKLLDECMIGVSTNTGVLGSIPGKLNINTCPAEVLQMLPDIDASIADGIIAERNSKPNGFSSIVDLKNVEGVGRTQLANLYDLLTVRSNVFIITSKGRDARTGAEVEMIIKVDRSTLPAVIRGVRVQ